LETSDKLFELKNDFTLWRSRRKRGTPVQYEIKERACSLLDDYDFYRVVKACTASKNLLDTWKKNLILSSEEKKSQHFVELNQPLSEDEELKSQKLSIELIRASC
jgi:hypothetical protein